MTPATIVESVAADGIMLAITSTGSIEATGQEDAVNHWLPIIRAHKTGIIEALKVGAGGTATTSCWWLIHYPDRDPVEVAFSPEATHAEVVERHPDAVTAEPFSPIDSEAWEERAAIAEFDGSLSREDAEQLAWREDDRRRCDQCENLIARRCQAAKHGEIVASRNYEPIRDLPRRCDGFEPGVGDPDRRHGRERWPGLTKAITKGMT